MIMPMEEKMIPIVLYCKNCNQQIHGHFAAVCMECLLKENLSKVCPEDCENKIGRHCRFGNECSRKAEDLYTPRQHNIQP